MKFILFIGGIILYVLPLQAQTTFTSTEMEMQNFYSSVKGKKTSITNNRHLSWFMFRENGVQKIAFQWRLLYFPQDSITHGVFRHVEKIDDDIDITGKIETISTYILIIPEELKKRKIIDIFMENNDLKILYE